MAVLPTSGLSYSGYNGALTQVNGGGNGLAGSLVDARPAAMSQLARRLKGIPLLKLKAVLRSLATNGSGSAASATYVRRVAATGMSPQGGLIQIETVTASTGNTAAADVTEVQQRIFDEGFALAPSSYPADASGNGGGGKLKR